MHTITPSIRTRTHPVWTWALGGLLAMSAQPAAAATNVGGQITTNTTWTLANSPYVLIGAVNVWSGVTLTIEPGVVVKSKSYYWLNVGGTLNAVGTSGAHIVFTSIQDDSIAGDTGNDGPTTGAPGQWGSVRIDGATAAATLDYVDIRYGGKGSAYTYALLQVGNGSYAYVDHSTFMFSEWGGLAVASGTVNVQHSLFTQNKFGASFYSGAGSISNNSQLTSNTEVGVFMTYTGSYAGSPATITHSDIANNGSHGVLLWVASGIAANKAPSGQYNNIHNNDGGSTGLQLNSLHNVPQSIWTNNFWGPVVQPIECDWAPATTTKMHLSFSALISYCLPPPSGPVVGYPYLTSGCPANQPKVCAADAVTNNPYAQVPFDNSGY